MLPLLDERASKKHPLMPGVAMLAAKGLPGASDCRAIKPASVQTSTAPSEARQTHRSKSPVCNWPLKAAWSLVPLSKLPVALMVYPLESTVCNGAPVPIPTACNALAMKLACELGGNILVVAKALARLLAVRV